VANEQCAFHELATIKAGENAFAPKIKMLGLKAFAPDDAFFLWPIGAHFPFAFTCAEGEDDWKIPPAEGYMLLGQIAEARCTQVVNPKYTYICKVDKKIVSGYFG
jgi:hypothetical protein